MSWAFVERALRYLDEASRCTPQALRRLSRTRRPEHLRGLRRDVLFEPLRGPLQGLAAPRDLFTVPDDNLFCVDLLGDAVLAVEELRRRYFDVLTAAAADGGGRAVVWLVVDAHAHDHRALLHFQHAAGGGYALRALWVAQPELLRPGGARRPALHETLLLALAAFADERGAELRWPLAGALCSTTMACAFARGPTRPAPVPGPPVTVVAGR